jgi:hypothetical protein
MREWLWESIRDSTEDQEYNHCSQELSAIITLLRLRVLRQTTLTTVVCSSRK